MKFLINSPKNKELKAIWSYIGSYAEEGDKAIKTKDGKSSGYIFKDSNRWKHFIIVNENKDAFFLADNPRFLILEKGNELKYLNQNENWHPVLDGLYWVVCENKNKIKTSLPLRFGLNEKEKKFLLELAREAANKFLENGEVIKTGNRFIFFPRFNYRADLDVSFWVNGQFRGSSVITGRSLAEGIIEGSLSAIRDYRFKPVSKEELANARIEIVVFLNDRLVLDQKFIRENKIIPNKGYLLFSGRKSDWFLPEVFNVRRFLSLKDFLGDLASEKAGLPRNSYLRRKTKIEIFSVIDFIEGEKQEDIFDLWGPILLPRKNNVSEGDFYLTDNLEKRIKQAGDWLLVMQEEDGNHIPIINPLNGMISQIDWPRGALSAWSLSELSKITGEEKYWQSAEKYFIFLKKYLQDKSYLFSNRILISAYAGEIALSLSEKDERYIEEAEKLVQFILSFGESLLKTDSITIEQSLSFLSAWAIFQKSNGGKISEAVSEAIKEVANYIKKEFELKSIKQDCNLAIWAELAHSFHNLFLISGDKSDQEFIFKLADWLISFQNSNGSFWGTTNDPNFVYTRGTAKIFEILPDALNMAINSSDDLRIKKYKKAINACLTWLETMQYDENNVFFVKPELREKVIGGFRHDYFNQEAWIDTAAHFILGGARLLNLSNYGKRK